MKTFSSLKKFFLFLWTLFLCFNLNAQMILVSETDFSVAGGEDDYWHSTDMVDGYGGIIKPSVTVGGDFSVRDFTGAGADYSISLVVPSYAVASYTGRLDFLCFFGK